jgi:hypothetical protein
MNNSVYDDITDHVLRRMNTKPENHLEYVVVGVVGILDGIIDAMRSPHLQGHAKYKEDFVEMLNQHKKEIAKVNFTRLDPLELATNLADLCRSVIDAEDDKGRGNYENNRSERDNLIHYLTSNLLGLVCRVVCDLYLTRCYRMNTILNKAESIHEYSIESTEREVSKYPLLLKLVELIKSNKFEQAAWHMTWLVHDICWEEGRVDLTLYIPSEFVKSATSE